MKRIILVCVLLLCLFVEKGLSQAISDSALQRQSYLFDEFITGTVVSKSGEVNRAPLNYCAYDQSIVFKTDKQIMTLTGLEAIDTIFIGDRKFIPVGQLVYEILSEKGKIQLCGSYTGKLVPLTATIDHNGASKQKSGEVSNTISSVYVSKPYKGEFAMQISRKFWLKSYNKISKANNVRDFMKVFKEATNPSINEYVRQNHINFSDEKDLITLVDFCNKQ